MTEETYPFQMPTDSRPEHLRHVSVIDFRGAIPPGAMCERTRTSEEGKPRFITPYNGLPRFFGETTRNDPEPVRSIAMLHVWLSDEGDVAPGSGWTRRERWETFWALAERGGGPRIGLTDDSGLFAEAIRYLQAPYHISAGTTADGDPFVALCHPPNLYTHHGGDANRETVGIGFGWGRDLSCMPVEQEASLEPVHALGRRDAVEAALWAAHEHYGVRTLVTHAQSSRGRCPYLDGRGGDPGTHIMRAAGYAARSLLASGVHLDPDFERTWGTGRAPPPAWSTAWNEGMTAAVKAYPAVRLATDAAPVLSPRDVAAELSQLLPRIGHQHLRNTVSALANLARECGGRT